MDQRSPYPVSAHYQPRSGHPSPPAYPPAAGRGGQGQAQPSTPPHPAPPRSPQPPLARPQSRHMLVGGSMLALAAMVITPQLSQTQQATVEPFTCIKQENPKAVVSRDQLKALLDAGAEAPRAQVQELLKAPYCVLSPGQTEAGQPADREAYPLEFDPQTWLVVLYQGDRYAGYDFRFR